MGKCKKLKVAYLDYSECFAGAERVLYTMISNLGHNKFEPILVFPYPMNHQKQYDSLNCRKVYLADSLKSWMGSARWKRPLRGTDFLARTIWGIRLASLIRKEKIDILHINLLRPDSTMWILPVRFATNCKIVGHFRSQSYEWIPPKIVQKNCDVILCVSKYSRRRLLLKGNHTNTLPLYDSVDVNSFTQSRTKIEAKAKLNLPQDAFIISSIGQLSRQKGHDNAIFAFAKIANKYPNAVLYIAGGGADLNYLHDIADKFQEIRNRIIFTDAQVSDIKTVYSASDLVLSLTKVGEAFGLVPYEACLMGVPFIGPGKGAILEFVKDGENGLLVETYDVDRIVKKIEWAINHPDKCIEMTKRLKETINNSLLPEIMVKNLEGVYNTLLES